MTRPFRARGISVFVNLAACAHLCRYCSTGTKKVHAPDFGRVVAIVEKLCAWRDAERGRDFEIDLGIGHSHDYDVETLASLETLRERVRPREQAVPRCIYLGGLHLRSTQQMRQWLEERRDRAGIQAVHAALAGCGSIHDRWNNRGGDFDYLMQTMRTAASLGLRLRQRVFVLKSTLPVLDDLLARLETLGGAERYPSLFFYRGSAVVLEEERITEEILDGLAPALRQPAWRSERQWLKSSPGTRPELGYLKIHLTRANLAQAEALPVHELVLDLETRTRAAYDALPSTEELAERAGDVSNDRVYSSLADLECKWLDQYVSEYPVRFERHLTHLWKQFWHSN